MALSGEPEALRLAACYGSFDSVEEKRFFADLQRKVRPAQRKVAKAEIRDYCREDNACA